MSDITVLLVDDHEMVVDSFRRVLATADDLEVVGIASTAAGAIAMAIEHRPDVILLDYVLPDGHGTDAARRILTEIETKILLLTGTDDREVLFDAVDAGCVGYLQKTHALDELVPAVRTAAGGALVLSRDQLQLLATASKPSVETTSELTPREQEILELLGEGLTNRAIAQRLELSVNTVRTHVQTVLKKLGAHSKLQAVAIAVKRGLLPGGGAVEVTLPTALDEHALLPVGDRADSRLLTPSRTGVSMDFSDDAWAGYRSCVLQASGMVSEQAQCTLNDALRLLRDRAFAQHVSIVELSEAVLARDVRFD